MKKPQKIWIYSAGVIVAIFGGVSWYAYFGAPSSVVKSARDGTCAFVITGLMAPAPGEYVAYHYYAQAWQV